MFGTFYFENHITESQSFISNQVSSKTSQVASINIQTIVHKLSFMETSVTETWVVLLCKQILIASTSTEFIGLFSHRVPSEQYVFQCVKMFPYDVHLSCNNSTSWCESGWSYSAMEKYLAHVSEFLQCTVVHRNVRHSGFKSVPYWLYNAQTSWGNSCMSAIQGVLLPQSFVANDLLQQVSVCIQSLFHFFISFDCIPCIVISTVHASH